MKHIPSAWFSMRTRTLSSLPNKNEYVRTKTEINERIIAQSVHTNALCKILLFCSGFKFFFLGGGVFL
jgi:hypothetical protein